MVLSICVSFTLMPSFSIVCDAQAKNNLSEPYSYTLSRNLDKTALPKDLPSKPGCPNKLPIGMFSKYSEVPHKV